MLPSTELELGTFRKSVERCCKEFELQLNSFGLSHTAAATGSAGVVAGVSSSAAGMGASDGVSLSSVVSELNAHFAHARRKHFLGRARACVLADYHNTMLANGDAAEVTSSLALLCLLCDWFIGYNSSVALT